MGERGFYEEISSVPGAGDGYLETFSDDQAAFILQVRGDSMHPAIRDGWFVLVEPGTRPAPGEYVLVRLKDGRKMVKELLYERRDAVSVISVNGDERLNIPRDEVESVYAVTNLLPPSKWKPD